VPRTRGGIEHPGRDDAASTVGELDAEGIAAPLNDADALGEERMPAVVDRQHQRVSIM
jgi:hypothetical protein